MFGLLAIIILSLLFRITFLPAIEFKSDEALAVWLATRPLFSHPLPPGASVSSVGVLNPPLFLYLLFPFVLISYDPQFISAAIGFLNALSIAAFYLIIKRYFDKKTALFSSLLFATAPWAIIFSRKIWAQDFILPLFIPLLYAFFKLYIDKKPIYWLPYTALTILLLQIHQSLIFFLLPFNIFLLLKKIRLHILYIGIGFLLGLLPLIPYLIFEFSHGFPNLYQIFHTDERLSLAPMQYLQRPFQILQIGNFFSLMGDDIAPFAANNPLLFKLRPLFYLEYLLLIAGGVLFYRTYKNLRFILYAFALLPFFYFLFRIPPFMHYYIILLPFLFLFVGLAVSYIFTKNKYLGIGSTTVFIMLSLAFNTAFFTFVSEKGHLSGEYGTTYAASKKATKALLKKYEGTKDYEEMYITAFIPRDFMHGDTLLAESIYDYDRTAENLQKLDDRLKSSPQDPRPLHEIFAYYTRKPATVDMLNELRNKSRQIPLYEEIYNNTYRLYLEKSLRDVLISPLGFALEYPRHWVKKADGNQTTLSGDGYVFIVRKLTQPCQNLNSCIESSLAQTAQANISEMTFLDQAVQKAMCLKANNAWCGNIYGPFTHNKTSFVLFFKPEDSQKQIKTGGKEFKTASAQETTILKSLRFID